MSEKLSCLILFPLLFCCYYLSQYFNAFIGVIQRIQLINELEKAGFIDRGGKGSHRNYFHQDCSRIVTISGKKGSDARRYQIWQVENAIKRGEEKMRRESDLYKKIVYWGDGDDCFIGACPELMYGGVHGEDAFRVFVELTEAVEEVIQILKKEGKPLPEPKGLVLEMA